MPPLQGGRPQTDPFGRYKHNTQLAPSVPDTKSLPDGRYSFRTLDDLTQLTAALDDVRGAQDNSTVHILRVLHTGSLDFQSLSDLNQRAQSNVHVLIARKDE
jgi:hypothetical protein